MKHNATPVRPLHDLVRSYRYPIIHPPEERKGPEISPVLTVRKDILIHDTDAEFGIQRLPGGPRSVSVSIRSDYATVLCDCHDLSLTPRAYRIHLLPDCGDLSAEAKSARMAFAQRAILVFDSLMQGEQEPSVPNLERALSACRLPAADLVIFSIADKAVRGWAKDLGALTLYPAGGGELFLRWGDLVKACQQGRFLSLWQVRMKEGATMEASF